MKKNIKPYGDTLNDGVIQLSFTLPVEYGGKAIKAAEVYTSKLNFDQITVAHAKKIAEGFTYFVVFARAIPFLDYSSIVSNEVKFDKMDFYQINSLIQLEFKRQLSVIGATIGTDAHTVGIDAILNMKGYNQDYGLERYPEMKTLNMGSQVLCEDLIKAALEQNADALLVSQTVTQKDSHIRNFSELIELLEAENLRSRFILLAGGSRVTNDLAIELGYDAGFGPGTVPSDVASFIVTNLLKRRGKNA